MVSRTAMTCFSSVRSRAARKSTIRRRSSRGGRRFNETDFDEPAGMAGLSDQQPAEFLAEENPDSALRCQMDRTPPDAAIARDVRRRNRQLGTFSL
jgi:hypothetical protein